MTTGRLHGFDDIETHVVNTLRAAGCVFAEEEARLLLGEAGSRDDVDRMLEQRVSGIPLEHILGWALFDGIRVRVGDGVFVPRHRTEFLVQQAAEVTRSGDVVVDLCAGSGALGLALARRVPGIALSAADIHPAATRWARVNLEPVGGHVYQGDLFAALPGGLAGSIRTLVCNTPYVPTEDIALLPPEARLHEPRLTLDGGADGLDIQRRVAGEAARWLAPGGFLFVEAGEAQAEESARMMAAAGLEARVLEQPHGDATVVSARRPRHDAGRPAR